MLTNWYETDLDNGVLAHWSIPRDLAHVTEARRHIQQLAETAMRNGDRAHDVGVCASETIGNAIVHGRGDEVRIFVCADESVFSVEVIDDGSGGLPHELASAVDLAESGRGLMIVAALADNWSHLIDPDTGELVVIFDFTIDPGPPSGDPR